MTQEIKQRIQMINNGEAPQGYKKTKVGIVPDEWEEAELSNIFVFKNGLNKEKEAFGKGTPIVNYTDVWKKRGLKKSDINGKVELSQKEIENYSALKGDVFFTRTSETKNEIGLTSVLLENIDNAVFSGFVLRARPKNNKIVEEYNQYCYSSELMRYEIIRKSSITTRALTNGTLLGQVQLNLPNRNEQAKIAEILMKWDEAILFQEKLIGKLEVQRKALMQKLLATKDGWKETVIKKLITPQNKSSRMSGDGTNEGEYAFFTNNSNEETKFLSEYDLDGEYIICNTGGVAYFNYFNGKFAYMSDCYVFSSNNNIKFIYYFLKTKEYYINSLGFTGSGIKHLDKNWFNRLRVILPNAKQQQKIADILSKADEHINLQKQRLNKLKQQQKSLMQLLLTGIVRV